MSFRSAAVFRCDGCKVAESDEIEIIADIMQARPPLGWLRVQVNKLTPRSPDEALDEMGVKHYCPYCAPLIESYLAGRKEEPQETSAEDEHLARLRRWKEKATRAIGPVRVQSIIDDMLEEGR